MIEQLLQNQQWLNIKFLENTYYYWLSALLLFFIVWLGLVLLRKATVKYLKKIVNIKEDDIYYLIVETIRHIHPLVFPIIALFFAFGRLRLPPYIDKTVYVIVTVTIVVQLIFVASKIIDFSVNRLRISKSTGDLNRSSIRKNLSTLIKSFVWIGGILFLLSNFGVDVTTFITGLGIGGIAIALAAQSILGDVFSSFTIAIDKPFEAGDFITVDNLKGTVERIGLKTTRVRSPEGDLLVFSNSDLTKARIRISKKDSQSSA